MFPVYHLVIYEIRDQVFVKFLDHVRVQVLFCCPSTTLFEHLLLTPGGADALFAGFEPGCSLHVLGTTADEVDDFTVQGVYGLADVLDFLALLREVSIRRRNNGSVARLERRFQVGVTVQVAEGQGFAVDRKRGYAGHFAHVLAVLENRGSGRR